ncbi:putative glycosyltransferase YkoN [Robertmurraya siralis]|uniref:Glycosyltransferase YkoN n=1 Tax=Robertmurraya siralis TaxID=77777 RepID=A0A919WFC9_9BACI|nr:glycosyltransferase [Robertmurraya siralis]GIN60941.1 putative glycosyltransferase YkoN [Robertmurraya siralis]
MGNYEKTVLFLPFLQIPSGHHQVANALIDSIERVNPALKCEKKDILAYGYGKVEKFISKFYINWIASFPTVYNLIYQNTVYKEPQKEKRYRAYEFLFLRFMKKLIAETDPDVIVCTHSLPSYMLNYLKQKAEIKTPIINVYTDYFIHQLWGINCIDQHFVPTAQMKELLMEKGVREEQIFITGIPVHNKITKLTATKLPSCNQTFTVVVSGGNLGIGSIEELLEDLINHYPNKLKLIVLCGKNKELYKKISSLKIDYIEAYPFIANMEKMNQLYDEMDAIITKPGGVTISECIYKRKPIFIYHALPGQEQINLEHLKEYGLVFHLKKKRVLDQVFSILKEEKLLQKYQYQIEKYHSEICSTEPAQLIAQWLESR